MKYIKQCSCVSEVHWYADFLQRIDIEPCYINVLSCIVEFESELQDIEIEDSWTLYYSKRLKALK